MYDIAMVLLCLIVGVFLILIAWAALTSPPPHYPPRDIDLDLKRRDRNLK
jgi:hypothetical protein